MLARICLAVGIVCVLGGSEARASDAIDIAIYPLPVVEEPVVEENESVDSAAFDDLLTDDDLLTNEKQQPGTAERLEKLEAGYSELQTNYGELSDSYSALQKKLKLSIASGHTEAKTKLSGRIHLDHWAIPNSSPAINIFENGDPAISPQDRFGFRRLRFGVQGDLWKTMLYKIELELAGGNKTEFRDAYLGWEEIPVLQTLLIGNQKRPYGLDHLNSSRYNVFMERPFVIEAINQDARRLGIESYGVSEDEAWNWRYGVFNQRLIQDEGFYISDHYQLELAGRIANTFWYDEASDGRGYGHVGLSGTFADPDANGGTGGRATNEARFRHRGEARSRSRWIDTGIIENVTNYGMVGVENVWNFGPVQLVSEYQNLWAGRTGDPDLHFHGGYAYLSYFLTGEHMVWSRSKGTLGRVKPIENFFLVDTCSDGIRGGWGAWQIAYRYSYGDFSDDNIYGGIGKTHTLGMNWYWNAYARMQFNAIYGEIDDHQQVDDDGQLIGPVLSGDFAILGARFMVDF